MTGFTLTNIINLCYYLKSGIPQCNYTVNSDIFARLLFSRGFYFRETSFRKLKLLFTDAGKNAIYRCR